MRKIMLPTGEERSFVKRKPPHAFAFTLHSDLFFFFKGGEGEKKGGARRNKEVCLFYTSLAIKIAIGPDYYFVFPSLYCSNFMYLIIRCSLISVI